MWIYTSIPYLAAWKSAARILLNSAIWARNWKKCPFPLSSHSLRNHRQSMLPVLEVVWSLLCEHALPFGSGLISSFIGFCSKVPLPCKLRTPLFTAREGFLATYYSDFWLQLRRTGRQWDERFPWKKRNMLLKGFACDIDWEMFPFKLSEMQDCCEWINTSLKGLRW